ncbi:B-cell receptor CD22-like [Pagrus major]|uniref:B-cell receptor CD22-like n=1 Tax=Pagrus major TaxID=143350 RepID=UPI003CC85364
MSPPASEVKEGTKVTLTCNVTKSHPQPQTYSWYKDEKKIGEQKVWSVEKIQPDDRGSYTCRATNTAGNGTSEPRQIQVRYGPRNTIISVTQREVRVDTSVKFTCQAEAYPAPKSYSWYRYSENKPIDSSQWQSKTTNNNELYLQSVKSTDEACYMCNATNDISTGWNSKQLCIKVLYPPTNLTLSMDSEVTEGQRITIKCTVDSAPTSTLSLTTPNSPDCSDCLPQCDHHVPSNALCVSFNVTSAHSGGYTCTAWNGVGSTQSNQRKLVVKYRPKDVTVKASPHLIVNENEMLTLQCNAHSHPAITSYEWMKMTDGKKEIMNRQTETITIKPVIPSDSGLYSCAASNEIGTGESQPAEVKVKYAPKYVNVMNGKSLVVLTCSSDCYPPVRKYSWYRKKSAENKKGEYVSSGPSRKVYSDDPGHYYCIAENDIDKKSSDPVQLFVYPTLQ